VDLTGDWKNDLTANIQGGVGKATIRLPSDVGVRASAQGGIGAVHVQGLKKDGDAYVNEVYGKSPVTVNVRVEGGVGEIDLELGEAPPSV
jgi:predicted membrane protein